MSAKADRLLKLYEDDLFVRFSEQTVRGYLYHVRACLSWLEARGVELSAAKPDDMTAHQAALLAARHDGKPYSIGYQQNRVSALKSFFGFLVRRGYLLQDPSRVLDMPRPESRLPRAILTRDEARRIIEAARGTSPRVRRDRALLETLYATGVRAGELIAVTPYDIDTEDKTLHVVLGKGRKGRLLPLTTAAARAIDSYLVHGRPKLEPKARFLFLSNWGRKLYVYTANQIVHGYAKKAGVKKRVTCHTFRHSVATHLLKGRADIRQIQALLGHRSLQTTERYTRVEIQDLREVVRRAHPRGR